MHPASYHDRQNLEMSAWPELEAAVSTLGFLVRGPGQVSPPLKNELLLVSSIAAGCGHCQTHGAYGLHLAGTPVSRVLALWDFENSDQFTAGELAAYRLARDASVTPNSVTPDHFEALRQHFTDREIVEILAVIALNGFLNRYNDTVAVVTDRESVAWATENLEPVGWTVGKHAGAPGERRSDLPPYMRRLRSRSGAPG